MLLMRGFRQTFDALVMIAQMPLYLSRARLPLSGDFMEACLAANARLFDMAQTSGNVKRVSVPPDAMVLFMSHAGFSVLAEPAAAFADT